MCHLSQICLNQVAIQLALYRYGMVVHVENDGSPCLVSQAIMASKIAADKPGSKGSLGGPNRTSGAGVSYLEVGSLLTTKGSNHAGSTRIITRGYDRIRKGAHLRLQRCGGGKDRWCGYDPLPSISLLGVWLGDHSSGAPT